MNENIPIAIVTGATRGIGKAIIKKLSQNGMNCVAIGSNMESIKKIRLNEHLYFANPFQTHFSLAINLAQWPRWTEKKLFPGYSYFNDIVSPGEFPIFPKIKNCYIDLLVNCAGKTHNSLSLRTSTSQIEEMMNINLLSAVSLCNLATKQMLKTKRLNIKSRISPSPCIINISSKLGEAGMTIPGTSIYSMSKAAMTQYTNVLAQEAATWDIRTVPLSPGLVKETDMIKDLDPRAREQLVQNLLGLESHTVDDIANKVWDVYQGNAH